MAQSTLLACVKGEGDYPAPGRARPGGHSASRRERVAKLSRSLGALIDNNDYFPRGLGTPAPSLGGTGGHSAFDRVRIIVFCWIS
jgi:hypothetical protein